MEGDERRGVTVCSLALWKKVEVRGVTVFGSCGGRSALRLMLQARSYFATAQDIGRPSPPDLAQKSQSERGELCLRYELIQFIIFRRQMPNQRLR